MNAPAVNFSITNLSFSVASILKGISYVQGVTLRGPFASPNVIITNWTQFQKIYGGYLSNSDFPLMCKRAFDRGAILRVSRTGHYTTIGTPSSLDAVKASMVGPVKVLFSAGLVASNVYDLTINGVALSSTTYASSSDATFGAILTKIKASAAVEDAYFVESSTYRTIIILPVTNTALTLTGSAVTAGSSQATTTITTQTGAVSATDIQLWTMAPLYAGADYNNINVKVSAASNGNSAYFKLTITHALDSTLTEIYDNLTITGNPTVINSHYLDAVIAASQLMAFTYNDLSGTSGQQTPSLETYYFASGSDGSTPVLADYTGDAAGKNGLHAFDGYSDTLQIATPAIDGPLTTAISLANQLTHHAAGAAYAAARADLIYFAHLDNAYTTAATLITARQGTSVDSYYCAWFAGGLVISDPVTGINRNISEMGDILGIMAVNDAIAPWFSPAGTNRGLINNVLGIVNNFGGPAMYTNLTLLASAQINMVIQQNNQIYLGGNYSSSLKNSKLSFLNGVRFLIYMQQTLAPALTSFLQEPGDIPTFKAIFREVEPVFNDWVTGRAIQKDGWSWQGDQDAKDLNSLVVNNPTDLDNGIYKVNLYIKLVGSLQAININVIVTATSVSFTPAN